MGGWDSLGVWRLILGFFGGFWNRFLGFFEGFGDQFEFLSSC